MADKQGVRWRVLVVGATGTLGRAVAAELGARHEIISAGRTSGDLRLDLSDAASICDALAQVGKLDAVVSAAGHVEFAPLADFQPAGIGESRHTLGLTSKLLGQINLALAARDQLRDGGSITLTTGITFEHPIAGGSSASMVNGALEGFVRSAAIELPRGLRINAVSPNVLVEASPAIRAIFPGFEPVPAARAALAFTRSVEGRQTGQVYRVF
ncbi:NAD(P)-dependent dehydrogenase, short-chain alcohol dehydrogenase family [Singulisphaera sp. GP187]|uniref:short chain dehydrogenase n=1 Tax=Singulisphaera sp. GP187 TaxID=1882752 RepID=UPI0009279893|nr:short chain dehydrogenase [Singulisphaera sp. GP187]SIO38493.1 NAD(P)-dependent dehydrogenase, short-chain alcohol dehydrogenase family [Singulisphaera sp. GP187]